MAQAFVVPNTPRSHQERRRTRSGLKGAFFTDDSVKTWMPGTRPCMTRFIIKRVLSWLRFDAARSSRLALRGLAQMFHQLLRRPRQGFETAGADRELAVRQKSR